MSAEAVISHIASWFQQYIGRYIFRKTKLRHQFRERLIEIINGFADTMADYGKSCSLLSVMRDATTDDVNKEHQIQSKLDAARILGKWYAEFKECPKIVTLKNVSKSFDQFASILHETQSVFTGFVQTISNDDRICKKLKRNSYGYPYFEKIYNDTISDFERLCREARKELKDEFKEHLFTPLPKL